MSVDTSNIIEGIEDYDEDDDGVSIDLILVFLIWTSMFIFFVPRSTSLVEMFQKYRVSKTHSWPAFMVDSEREYCHLLQQVSKVLVKNYCFYSKKVYKVTGQQENIALHSNIENNVFQWWLWRKTYFKITYFVSRQRNEIDAHVRGWFHADHTGLLDQLSSWLGTQLFQYETIGIHVSRRDWINSGEEEKERHHGQGFLTDVCWETLDRLVQ